MRFRNERLLSKMGVCRTALSKKKAGHAVAWYGDVPHLQCKVLTNEVEGGSFPCHPNAQPLKICDAEDVHKHVG